MYLSRCHMLLKKDIISIGLIPPYYNFSLTPYIGNMRQHICYVLTTISVSLVQTYQLFGSL